MTELQERLCNLLQKGLPICRRPFQQIADRLGCTEQQVLEDTRDLCQAGIIRRMGPIVNAQALGGISTLVMAHVPDSRVHKVVDAVNPLPGVSHNYLRTHYYNLWFTLQGSSLGEIQGVLSSLADRLGVEFHSLPARRVLKLEVFFDATGREHSPHEPQGLPCTGAVELTPVEWRILSDLQKGLQVESLPFDGLGDEGLKGIEDLICKGVVRRIGAVVDHHKLGYTANALFVAEVPEDRIAATGMALACLTQVSHCYQREPLSGWPYTLYAMVHGRCVDEIRGLVTDLVRSQGLNNVLLLETLQEFKKRPVMHTSDGLGHA